MIKTFFFSTMLMALFSISTLAAQPVLVADYMVDTSLYENNEPSGRFRFSPGPYLYYSESQNVNYPQMILWAFRRKNSNEIDIYSYNGKIGTSLFPVFTNKSEAEYYSYSLLISCFFVDDDPDWEAIVNENKTFTLYDHDGTQLLSDTGDAGFGFDGASTYIVTKKSGSGIRGFKTWRLRTNVNSGGQPLLQKRNAGTGGMMQLCGLNDGQYQVSLSSQSGNGITFQLFDMLGRCIMTKKIQGVVSPVTFSIPETDVPNTPFIAKTQDGVDSEIKKVIPIHK